MRALTWLWLVPAGVLAAAPAFADDTAPDLFAALNTTASAIYQDAKHLYLAAADPVVIVDFDHVRIRERGTVREVGWVPRGYSLMKAVGHTPRSLWAALRPAVDGLDPDGSWRGKLDELRVQAAAVRAILPDPGLSPAANVRDARMLDLSIAMIERYLATGLPSRDGLQADMRLLAPLILADAAEAARLQIDAIDADLRPWWDGLGADERARTFVLVLGPKTPREGNLAFTYFVNLLGVEEAGHRVVYAEGIFDLPGADSLLSTLLTDRRLSTDFFADERRMERDILADGAEARILEIFGRLGTP